MSGHTPGPWRIVQEDGYWVVRAANYDAVCRLYAGGNGDLIAAAPDLLEACKAGTEISERTLAEDGGFRTPEAQAVYDMVCAAIAKAEGR